MAHPHRMASPPFRVEVFPTGLAAVVDRNGVNWGTGAGRVLFASKVQTLYPSSFALTESILILVLVIFGGMGSLPGAVLGAAVLQWLPQFLRGKINQADLFLYLGALLVIMMIFRPQGIWPSRRRARELALAEAGLTEADAVSAPTAGEVQ